MEEMKRRLLNLGKQRSCLFFPSTNFFEERFREKIGQAFGGRGGGTMSCPITVSWGVKWPVFRGAFPRENRFLGTALQRAPSKLPKLGRQIVSPFL